MNFPALIHTKKRCYIVNLCFCLWSLETPFLHLYCRKNLQSEHSTKESLKMHLWIRASTKANIWEYCKKAFSTRTSFKMHQESFAFLNAVGDVFQKMLIWSRKEFTVYLLTQRKSIRRYNLFKNLFRIYNGDKPYTCGLCARAFYRFKYLQSHLQCHTREKFLYSLLVIYCNLKSLCISRQIFEVPDSYYCL